MKEKSNQVLSSAFEVHGKDKIVFCDVYKIAEEFTRIDLIAARAMAMAAMASAK